MKLKRDHGYAQQKRLKYERAINKYTGNLQKRKYYNKFHNKCNSLHYQEITNQFDFESQLTTKRVTNRKNLRYFEKFSKLDVSMVSAQLLSLCDQGTLVMYKVFLFSSSALHDFMHKFCLVLV